MQSTSRPCRESLRRDGVSSSKVIPPPRMPIAHNHHFYYFNPARLCAPPLETLAPRQSRIHFGCTDVCIKERAVQCSAAENHQPTNKTPFGRCSCCRNYCRLLYDAFIFSTEPLFESNRVLQFILLLHAAKIFFRLLLLQKMPQATDHHATGSFSTNRSTYTYFTSSSFYVHT